MPKQFEPRARCVFFIGEILYGRRNECAHISCSTMHIVSLRKKMWSMRVTHAHNNQSTINTITQDMYCRCSIAVFEQRHLLKEF